MHPSARHHSQQFMHPGHGAASMSGAREQVHVQVEHTHHHQEACEASGVVFNLWDSGCKHFKDDSHTPEFLSGPGNASHNPCLPYPVCDIYYIHDLEGTVVILGNNNTGSRLPKPP